MANKINLYRHDGTGEPIGEVHISRRLPTHIVINGVMYERYGQVSAYRYLQLPEGFCYEVPSADFTIY